MSLIQNINTIRKEKEAKRKAKIQSSREAYMAKKAKTTEMDTLKGQERKKEFFKELGQKKRTAEIQADRSMAKKGGRQ